MTDISAKPVNHFQKRMII